MNFGLDIPGNIPYGQSVTCHGQCMGYLTNYVCDAEHFHMGTMSPWRLTPFCLLQRVFSWYDLNTRVIGQYVPDVKVP